MVDKNVLYTDAQTIPDKYPDTYDDSGNFPAASVAGPDLVYSPANVLSGHAPTKDGMTGRTFEDGVEMNLPSGDTVGPTVASNPFKSGGGNQG